MAIKGAPLGSNDQAFLSPLCAVAGTTQRRWPPSSLHSATKCRFSLKGEPRAPHPMAATCLIRLPHFGPSVQTAWTDHSKTHLSAVKSPDNSRHLQDKEKIPELAIKASTLPPDTLHCCTDHRRDTHRLWTHTCAHADYLGGLGDSLYVALLRISSEGCSGGQGNAVSKALRAVPGTEKGQKFSFYPRPASQPRHRAHEGLASGQGVSVSPNLWQESEQRGCSQALFAC